ncbi:hypothetical protein L6R52_01550 [Myxococcota bacterium]|nr:hypothetical protein [Myxococcota bacterium]
MPSLHGRSANPPLAFAARTLAALAVAALATLAACASTDGAGTPDGGTTSGSDASTGDPDVLAGMFDVRLVAPVPASDGVPETPGFTAFSGKVYDGPTPSPIIWETTDTSGDCALLEPRVPSCLTPCGGGALCVEDETCAAYPTSKDVGTVTVTGLATTAGATRLTIAPIANSYQPAGSVSLPYPAFAEGDVIRVAAAGGVYAPFSVESQGIVPLVVTSTALVLERAAPLVLTWTPGGTSVAPVIAVQLDISHHGGTKGKIECTVADSAGTLTIAASLVTKLLDLGVAGFPTVVVTRRLVGSTVIAPGRVELVVSEDVERDVTIPGLVSCVDDGECDDGTTCQADLTCR